MSKIEELLRDELEKRGFYFTGTEPLIFAPMINGFKCRESSAEYLSRMLRDYLYVAYKNLDAAVGFENRGKHEFTACLFIPIGSQYGVNLAVELTVFYQGRMYKYACKCSRFFFEMFRAHSTPEMKEIWIYAERAVDTWQRSIRTLIIENRWPEEEYISDIKFLEEK